MKLYTSTGSPTGASALFPLPVSVYGALPGYHTPYVEEYNLAVQQQIGGSMNIQLAYVGNTARHQFYYNDANPPNPNIPGATASNYNSRRPYEPGTLSSIYNLFTGANPDYNALQVSFTRRMSHGMSLLANYTYSRAIDISDDYGTTYADLFDVNLDRARAGFDITHALALSWIAQAPQLNRWGWAAKEALGGWQLSGIMTAYSGEPVNILSGVNSSLDGLTYDRPNLVGNPDLPGRSRAAQIREFFNTAAFAPATGFYGTAGRDIVNGPAAVNWNVSLSKDFHIHESQSLQLRIDSFNLFNEVNFAAPSATRSSSNFGQLTATASNAAGNGRIFQFALRYLF
jgi:hypothetical protein